MYAIVRMEGKTKKVVSGNLETRIGAETLLEIYKVKIEPNGVIYYIKEIFKGKK